MIQRLGRIQTGKNLETPGTELSFNRRCCIQCRMCVRTVLQNLLCPFHIIILQDNQTADLLMPRQFLPLRACRKRHLHSPLTLFADRNQQKSILCPRTKTSVRNPVCNNLPAHRLPFLDRDANTPLHNLFCHTLLFASAIIADNSAAEADISS